MILIRMLMCTPQRRIWTRLQVSFLSGYQSRMRKVVEILLVEYPELIKMRDHRI